MTVNDHIRTRVRRKIAAEGIRDKVLTGYDHAHEVFWLVTVDSHGEIDQSFAEWMPPESYAVMVDYLGRLARKRGAKISPAVVAQTTNGTLQ